MDTASPFFAQVIHDLSVVRPWILRSVLGTGFFELIGDGPMHEEELAASLGADPKVFAEVIGYLGTIGYVEVSDRIVNITEAGRVLAQLPRDLYAPGSPMLIFDRAASELDTAWTAGAPVAFRRSLPYWSEVARDPDACATIGRYQPQTAQFDGMQLVTAIAQELSPASSVLDLGGSNGALAKDLAAVHSGCIGVLDLPEMISNARQNLKDVGESRFAFHGGSFFEPVPVGYDIYVLNSILYDYSEHQVDRLLAGLHSSMSSGTVLVISEAKLAFPDPYTKAESTLMLTLNTGGSSRSAKEIASAAEDVGFGQPRRLYSSEQRNTLVFDR